MKLTDRELTVVAAVFESLEKRFTDDQLNYFLGSETIREMHSLYHKLYYREYCERHGIKYEDMTELDFEDAALENAEFWDTYEREY